MWRRYQSPLRRPFEVAHLPFEGAGAPGPVRLEQGAWHLSTGLIGLSTPTAPIHRTTNGRPASGAVMKAPARTADYKVADASPLARLELARADRNQIGSLPH